MTLEQFLFQCINSIEQEQLNNVGPKEIYDLQAELSRKKEDELEILFYKLLIRKNGILIIIMGRGRDPYVGLARKRPKTKWRLQWAENELITYIFAVHDICSILAT